jgi:hypothetical protein
MSKTQRALFNGLYRKNEVEDYPNIETYVKLSSICHRLIVILYSNYCLKGLKSSKEKSYFNVYCNGALI